uniref:Uncharacterized protein n=1 Tax=Prolemur simus TaxID=1328070 RepID=A0A8C9DIH9_PROSS
LPACLPLWEGRPPLQPAAARTRRPPALGGLGRPRVGVPPSGGRPVREGAVGRRKGKVGGMVAPRGLLSWGRLTSMSESTGLFLPPCRVGVLPEGPSCLTEEG